MTDDVPVDDTPQTAPQTEPSLTAALSGAPPTAADDNPFHQYLKGDEKPYEDRSEWGRATDAAVASWYKGTLAGTAAGALEKIQAAPTQAGPETFGLDPRAQLTDDERQYADRQKLIDAYQQYANSRNFGRGSDLTAAQLAQVRYELYPQAHDLGDLAADVGGTIGGGFASPESLVLPEIKLAEAVGVAARPVLSRILNTGASMAAVQAATEPFVQGAAISGGQQSEFDPVSAILAPVEGFGMGAGLSALHEAAAPIARAVADTFRAARARLSRTAPAFADPSAPVVGGAPAGTTAAEATTRIVAPAPDEIIGAAVRMPDGTVHSGLTHEEALAEAARTGAAEPVSPPQEPVTEHPLVTAARAIVGEEPSKVEAAPQTEPEVGYINRAGEFVPEEEPAATAPHTEGNDEPAVPVTRPIEASPPKSLAERLAELSASKPAGKASSPEPTKTPIQAWKDGEAARRQIVDDVRSQSLAEGHPAAEANEHAALAGAYFHTDAIRRGLGENPMDLYRAEGLQIRRGKSEAPAEAGVIGFRTAKGSEYVAHADGTTTRNKAARSDAGHEGDSGPKPRTERTVYVDSDASALSAAGLHGVGEKGARLAIKDGRATLLTWNEKGGRWGASPSARDIPVSDKPGIGKHPLELWGRKDDVPGYEAYSRQHAGNKIVGIDRVPASGPSRAAFEQAGGIRAHGIDWDKAERAAEMFASGASNEDVYRETGWYMGPDGKMRFEVPDNDARLMWPEVWPEGWNGDALTLKDVLDAPTLYAAYPHLRDVEISPGVFSRTAKGTYTPPGEEQEALSNKVRGHGGRINLSMGLQGTEALSVLAHEIQHAIQQFEDHAGGARIEEPKLPPAVQQQMDDLERENLRDTVQGRRMGDNRRAAIDSVRGNKRAVLERMHQDAADNYRRLYGEVEARNSQRRLSMSPEERAARAPYETFDVDEDRHLVEPEAAKPDYEQLNRLLDSLNEMVSDPEGARAHNEIAARLAETRARVQSAMNALRQAIPDFEPKDAQSWNAARRDHADLVQQYDAARRETQRVERELHTHDGSRSFDQPATVPTFYSAVERAVTAAKQAKASPEQWAATLKNTPGVKPEELKFLGLEEWLSEAANAEGVPDSSLGHAQSVSNFSETHTFQAHGFGGLDVPAKTAVLKDVFAAAQNNEIRQAIITAIPIDVMDILRGKELSPKRLFDNQAVFLGLFPIVSDANVPIGVNEATSIIRAVARRTAEMVRESPDVGRAFIPGGAANKAGDESHRGTLRQRLISKQEVADFVRANRINVQEVHKGDAYSSLTQPERERLDELENYIRQAGFDNVSKPVMDEYDALAKRADFTLGPTKYGSYTLPDAEPGSYRELLLTLPPKGVDEAAAMVRARELANSAGDEWDSLKPSHQSMYLDDARYILGKEGGNYRSSHWEEPNILAHVRFNDRVIDGKKTLFVEEVQSDWHQEGRRRGYQTTTTGESLADLRSRLRLELEAATLAQSRALHDFAQTREGTPEYEAAERRYSASVEAENSAAEAFQTAQTYDNKVVPDAPLKTTWPEFALKRILRYAAENGYEKVAWAPGEVHADRYDLSKQISRIRVHGDGENLHVSAWDKNDHSVVDMQHATSETLPDVIGKEAADKILSQRVPKSKYGFRELSGLDLKVGGEGMAGFYDRILPAAANKLVKKFGSKVGTDKLPGERDGGTYVELPDGRRLGPFDDELEADNVAEEHPGSATVMVRLNGTPVHSLDITPALRQAAVEQGFPLFQKDAATSGEQPRGRITLADSRAIIDFFSGADASTIPHELAHLFLDRFARNAADPRVPQSLKDDFKTVLDWLGAERDKDITTEMHEKFARGFEQYLREGRAPSAGLAAAFEHFKQWLTAIYRNLKSMGAPISDEIRGVFDRMLATDQEIAARNLAEQRAAAAKAAPRPRGRAAADPQTWSLFEFLAAHGGLKPNPELAAILDGNPFVPGFGRLIRASGMSLDDALEASKQGHYLFDPADRGTGPLNLGANDLLDRLGDEAGGRRQYRIDHTPVAPADRAVEENHAINTLHTDLEAAGVNPDSIDAATRDRVVQIMLDEGVRDPLVAFDRAIMEETERNETAAAARREEFPDLPGWDDVHPDGGSAPDAGAETTTEPRSGAAEAGGPARHGGSDDRLPAGKPDAEPATERTAAGQQRLIPGVEPITDRQRLAASAARPLRGGDAAPPRNGLFDELARTQPDLQFRRRIGNAPAGPPPAAPSGTVGAPLHAPNHAEVLSAQQQAFALADAIGVPLRQGRVQRVPGTPSSAVLGQYSTRYGVARVRQIGDFYTVAHEGGHALEQRVGPDLSALVIASRAELGPLDYDAARRDPHEGFAEYFATMLTNPAAAQSAAPTFTQAFRQIMAQRDQPLLAKLDGAAAAYARYIAAPSGERVASNIVDAARGGWMAQTRDSVRRDGLPYTISMMLGNAYTAIFDQYAPISRAVRELTKGIQAREGGTVSIQPSKDPDKLMRLFGNAKHGALTQMRFGVVPYGGIEGVGPSLADAIAHAVGQPRLLGRWDEHAVESFSTYLVAKRVSLLWDRYAAGDLPNPPAAFSKVDADQATAQLLSAHPQFEDGAQMVHQFTRNMLDRQRDAGIISQDLHDKLTQTPFYVPLFRDVSDKPLAGNSGGASAQGPGMTQTVRKIRGSSRDIIDPIQGIMQQTFLAERTIRHNDIVRAFAEMADRAGFHAGGIVEPVPAQELKGVPFDLGNNIQAIARQRGLNPADTQILMQSVVNAFGKDPLLGTMFHMEPAQGRGEPILFYRVAGDLKAIRMSAGDEGMKLYETLTTLPQVYGDLWTKIAGFTTKTLRFGVVAHPTFALTNFIRDQMSVGILRSDYVPFLSGLRGVYSEFTQGDAAKLYTFLGGMSGGSVGSGVREAEKAEIAELSRRSYLASHLTSLEGLSELTQVTEAGTRISIFAKTYAQKLRQGLTPIDAAIEAAYQGTDILDFGRYGSRMLAIRALTPFINPHLQSLDKARRVMLLPLLRAARGEILTTDDREALRNAGWALGKFAAVGPVLGAAWAALNWAREEYRDATSDQKANNLIIPVGNQVARIPKPFEMSLGFTAGEYAYAALAKHDPRAASQLVGAFYEVLKTPDILTGNPLLKTAVETATGTSLFTGRSIVPQRLQTLAPQFQYTEKTSPLARGISNVSAEMAAFLNVHTPMQPNAWSPMLVDNAIGNLFGYLGKEVQNASQLVAGDKNSPESRLEDTGFLKRFTIDPTRYNYSIQQFYNLAGQRTGDYAAAAGTYQSLVDTHHYADAATFLGRLSDDQKAFTILQAAGSDTGKKAFKPDETRLNPVTRAQLAVQALNALSRELTDNRQLDTESNEPIVLSRAQRRDAIDFTRELGAVEMRNALVMIGDPGYAGRPIQSVQDQLDKIIAVSPELGSEIARRYATARIYQGEQVRDAWPEARQRLLRDGSDADLSDLTGEAKAAGWEFGGERTKRRQKERLVIPGSQAQLPGQ